MRMKTAAYGITIVTALMWIATPCVLTYEIGCWVVSDWFIFNSSDMTGPEILRLCIARTGICITAAYIEFSALRILAGRGEITGWPRTRLAFNILFAAFWLFAGTVFAIFYGHYLFGTGIYLLWIPCLTPLSTGLFYIAKTVTTIMTIRKR